jgi:hypothetical protein
MNDDAQKIIIFNIALCGKVITWILHRMNNNTIIDLEAHFLHDFAFINSIVTRVHELKKA